MTVMNRRTFITAASTALGASVLGSSSAEAAPLEPTFLVSVADPDAVFRPSDLTCFVKAQQSNTSVEKLGGAYYHDRDERRIKRDELLARLRDLAEIEMLKRGLTWGNYLKVHIKLLRDGLDWTGGMSDPFFPAAQLAPSIYQARWEIITRGVQLAYGQVRAPLKAAWTEKILRGESRFSSMPPGALFTEKLTEDEAREVGLLIPPHDTLQLLFVAK